MTHDLDSLHRTIKLELDEGRATSIEDAERIAARYVLQIDVADDISASEQIAFTRGESLRQRQDRHLIDGIQVPQARLHLHRSRPIRPRRAGVVPQGQAD